MSHVPPVAGVGATVGAVQGSVLAYTGIAIAIYLVIAGGLLLTGLILRRLGRESEQQA
jgi:hypothetical protein